MGEGTINPDLYSEVGGRLTEFYRYRIESLIRTEDDAAEAARLADDV